VIEIVRTAFQSILKDMEFRDEAEKSKLDVDLVTGEEAGDYWRPF
jgi:hypothetical protein